MPHPTRRTVTTALALAPLAGQPAAAAPIRLAALGDSLTAGYGLPRADGFVAKLEAALKAEGRDVAIVDAGVSGDTTGQGLARLEWSVPADVKGVIVELGANDMLRGIPPAEARANLDEILTRLTGRGQKVLLAGMVAMVNLGEAYVKAFNPIFPDLAKKHDALLYPFFLDGVAIDPTLTLPDGLHPNARGVDRIVAGILPKVRELIARIEG